MSPSRRYLLIPRAIVVYGRHLMLVRSLPGVRAPSSGRWHLPGGEVLEGESPQKAMARIVKLRSGLDVEVRGCIDALARKGADPVTGRPAPLLHLYFWCEVSQGTPEVMLPGDATSIPGLEHDGPPAPAALPGGHDWGWTDLTSGLAALKHDLVGPAVLSYLEACLADPRERHTSASSTATRPDPW